MVTLQTTALTSMSHFGNSICAMGWQFYTDILQDVDIPKMNVCKRGLAKNHQGDIFVPLSAVFGRNGHICNNGLNHTWQLVSDHLLLVPPSSVTRLMVLTYFIAHFKAILLGAICLIHKTGSR